MRAFCCLAALTTFATAAQAEATKYPLTLDNCGVEVTFDKAPATTVSLGQTATEILYSLDLADKVAGTGVWFSDVLPEFAEVNAKVERLADNDPSFESIVAKESHRRSSQRWSPRARRQVSSGRYSTWIRRAQRGRLVCINDWVSLRRAAA